MSQTLELKDVAPYRVTDASALIKPARIGEDKNPKVPARSSTSRPFLKHALRALQFVILPLTVLAVWWFASSREILPANILPSPPQSSPQPEIFGPTATSPPTSASVSGA
ncbi:MAG: hypothetical protein QM760_05530 [Nibricoccus sp.]